MCLLFHLDRFDGILQILNTPKICSDKNLSLGYILNILLSLVFISDASISPSNIRSRNNLSLISFFCPKNGVLMMNTLLSLCLLLVLMLVSVVKTRLYWEFRNFTLNVHIKCIIVELYTLLPFEPGSASPVTSGPTLTDLPSNTDVEVIFESEGRTLKEGSLYTICISLSYYLHSGNIPLLPRVN